jgi:hypothetical protein
MSSVIIAGNTSGTITLDAPNVAGTTVLTLPTANGTVLTTASSQVSGPAFSAYASSNQSISSSTQTKITFDTEVFDTNSNFASSRFTPTVAGYYQVTGGFSSTQSGSISRIILSIYKNGSNIYTVNDLLVTGYRFSGTGLVYCNGSTDYIEMYVLMVGTSPVLEAGSANTFFNGSMVRAA